MLCTNVLAELETARRLEVPKVAISARLLGTSAGVQFAAVFQSPLVGLELHVALPAKGVDTKPEG